MLHKETYSVRSGDISFLLSVVLEHAHDYEAGITFVILFWLFILVQAKLIVKNGRLVCIFNFQHSVLDLLSENISWIKMKFIKQIKLIAFLATW